MRGINVPDDPKCLIQEVRESTIYEYFTDQVERDARRDQLVSLARHPLGFYAHITRVGLKDVWGLTWTEPRGGELDAVRTSS